jgi:hypothetical protein
VGPGARQKCPCQESNPDLLSTNDNNNNHFSASRRRMVIIIKLRGLSPREKRRLSEVSANFWG